MRPTKEHIEEIRRWLEVEGIDPLGYLHDLFLEIDALRVELEEAEELVIERSIY